MPKPKVPSPELIAQIPGCPTSNLLSTMAAMDGDRPVAFFVVMTDQHGKCLGKHMIESFDDVVLAAEGLIRDAKKVWSNGWEN